MAISRREYCVDNFDGSATCYRDEGFWYSDKGVIVKWSLLVAIFAFFFAWFVGGYIHAKQRLRKGKKLLGYHRFLISYSERARYNQVPQNHFTFYQTTTPHAPGHNPNSAHTHPNNPHAHVPYTQRTDGAWTEPPPLYQNSDAPPQYYPPPQGASKVSANQNQNAQGQGVEMARYGQESGVVGSASGGQGGHGGPPASGSGHGDVEQGELPPRPQTARTRVMGVLERLRR